MEKFLIGNNLFLPNIDDDSFNKKISIKVSDDFLDAWKNKVLINNKEELSYQEIDVITKKLEILVRTFCKFISEYKGKNNKFLRVSKKKNPKDLVSCIDKGIEKLLRMWISYNFVDHKIIGEEGKKDIIAINDYVWYIDPIDGTLNFIKNNNRDIGLNISLIKNGHPILTLLGIPGSSYYVGNINRTTIEKVCLISGKRDIIKCQYKKRKITFGTEYDEDYKDLVLTRLDNIKKYFKVKTIPQICFSSSANLISFFDQKINVFYQDNVRFWDIMAPASMFYFMNNEKGNDIKFEIKILLRGNKLYDFFGNYDDYFISELNEASQKFDCQVGSFLVYSKHLGKKIEDIFKLTVFRKEGSNVL